MSVVVFQISRSLSALHVSVCGPSLSGFQNNVETAQYETTEAAVGQNVTLLCAIENQGPNMAVFSVEWLLKKHKTEEKVALLNVKYGVQLFWLNVSIAFNGDRSNQFMVSSLHLPEVTKSNGGTYICDFATFPSGSIRTETELRVKGKELKLPNLDRVLQTLQGGVGGAEKCSIFLTVV